jgi:hypothetical protein
MCSKFSTFIFNGDGDSIATLDAVQRLDIQDYINMRRQVLPTEVKWKSIRSMCITNYGRTLWQISEKYLDSLNARAIGTLESPVHLFEWILKNSSK